MGFGAGTRNGKISGKVMDNKGGEGEEHDGGVTEHAAVLVAVYVAVSVPVAVVVFVLVLVVEHVDIDVDVDVSVSLPSSLFNPRSMYTISAPLLQTPHQWGSYQHTTKGTTT